MKHAALCVLAGGIFILLPPLQMPPLTRFADGTGPLFAGKIFPFVFITIACGAISGFHALISSGTTPKLLANEADARFIGYGAMLSESLVATLALIAACILTPGTYFAINAPAGLIGNTVESASQVITQWGFVITPAVMTALAAKVHETSLLSRTGGAPSLAVGMANIFAKVLGGDGSMALWYHFAIMFEALFILTTLDAGTRVGRFMLQDLGKHIWAPFGRTNWYPAILMSSAVVVGSWGYFLYQGVTDPLGGVNLLWPIFGISNQLLAAIALCVGTTVIIRMGKVKYSFITIIPLTWLSIVALTGGSEKIFSADPKLGFLSHANSLAAIVAGGSLPAGAKTAFEASRMIFNDRLDAAVVAVFMIAVIVILLDSARVWMGVINGTTPAVSTEVPFHARAVSAQP